MRWTYLTSLSAFLVTVAAAGEPANLDLKKMQGNWTIVYVENQGKKEDKPAGDTVVFAGKKVTFSIGGEKDVADFKLSEEKRPGWFDITSGAYKSIGLYELKGDMLRVVLNQSGKDRPTAFKTEKDSPNERLFVLKRVK